jgi:hypothetical protein
MQKVQSVYAGLNFQAHLAVSTALSELRNMMAGLNQMTNYIIMQNEKIIKAFVVEDDELNGQEEDQDQSEVAGEGSGDSPSGDSGSREQTDRKDSQNN